MNDMKQGLPKVATSDLTHELCQPQLFYARRMTMMVILLSAMALITLTWLVISSGNVSTGYVWGFIFFSFVLLLNFMVHFKPYVRIGSDYVQVNSRRAYFDQIVKYEDFSKGFIINFNARPGETKFAYDEHLIVIYNRIKDDDKPKLVYTLNEAMLKAKAKKDEVK